MHQPTVKSLHAVSWSPGSADTSLSMVVVFAGLDLSIKYTVNFVCAVTLNAKGMSLTLLSHFLPLPWCSFSHLVLFLAHIGDTWAIIALCSGRVTMAAEPRPARSLICVLLALKYPAKKQYERPYNAWWMLSCSQETPVHFLWFKTTKQKRCKQIKFAHNTVSKEMDNDSNSVLNIVRCSFRWPTRNAMRLYLSLKKSHFYYYAPLIKLGHSISLILYSHNSCEFIKQKIAIHLTFFTKEIVAITPYWVGIWKLDVCASGTEQEFGVESQEGAGNKFYSCERIRFISHSCQGAGPRGHRHLVKPLHFTLHTAWQGVSQNRRQ